MNNEQIILLVEDSDADAELTAMAFQEARIGNPILRMRNGLAALDYLFAQGDHAGRDVTDMPAVVLLDLNLPLLPGLEVLRAIRGDARIRHLPVIILTSSNEDRDRLEAYDHFANSYVQKPVDYDQFVQASRQLGLYWLVLNRPAPRRDV
ncbi:response regulator [Chitinimonas sp. JJ19]|uniref:response regulator n=1 Tax=Chitinimonas sp. JJ19 TaxID=3109352 RepID=UPI002FFF5C33